MTNVVEVKKTEKTSVQLKDIMVVGSSFVDSHNNAINLVAVLKNAFGEGSEITINASSKNDDSYEVDDSDEAVDSEG